MPRDSITMRRGAGIGAGLTCNLLQSPNDFTQTAWGKFGVTVAPVSFGATSVIEDTSNGGHEIYQSFTGPSGSAIYSVSARVNPAGRSVFIELTNLASTAGAGAEFVLVGAGFFQFSGTFGTGFAISNIAIAPPDAQGFYLCTMTVTTGASPLFFQLLLENSSDQTTYIGGGTLGAWARDCSVCAQPALSGAFFVANTGSDSNPGTISQPWLTISKVNSQPFAPGSTISFRGGDTFNGNLTPSVVNGKASNPVVFGSYGTGRATINPTVGGFGQGIVNLDSGIVGVTIQDLILAAPSTSIQPRGGVRLANNSGIQAGGWVIQRCDISGIRFNSNVSSDFGASIMCELSPGSGGINNVTIKNNDIHGASGVNSLDDAGITGFGGQSASGWNYFGNLVWNIGTSGTSSLFIVGGFGQTGPPQGNGIHQNGVSNALVKYNIVHDMAANFNDPGAGPVCYTTNSASGVTIRLNEGYRMRPSDGTFVAVDFVGVDLDTDTSNCLVDYNFMHGCYNAGYYFFSTGGTWNQNTIRCNLGYNNCQLGRPGFGELAISIPAGTFPTIYMDNNQTYNDRSGWTGAAFGNSQQGADCFGIINDGGFFGSVSGNIQSTGVSRDGFSWWAFRWSTNSPDATNPARITNNQWFGLAPGSTQNFSWRNTYYSPLSAWQTASGKSGNSATNGAGPNIFATTATLGLSSSERTTAIAALTAVESIPGIDTGTTSYGIDLPGSRMASLITRFTTSDSPVTLPEYIALGFALTRADTGASNALLARIEPIALAAFGTAPVVAKRRPQRPRRRPPRNFYRLPKHLRV